jgi:four helix bundle protein
MATKSYRELIVWQKARDLAVETYKTTGKLPPSELYGIVSQMRRASLAISSNIAEWYHRFHPKERRQFFAIAFSSGAELESQLEIAQILFPQTDYTKTTSLLNEVMRLLNTFITR